MESKIPVNKYQTPITEELLQSLPLEVQDQLFDYINNVPFIQNLISPNREYAKDRPRDDKGRIIVDLSNPHILENMDYFRPSAIHFQKYGCYTFLRPNPNPNSEFGKWFAEEVRRCWEGYVRPSDGEWVTGYMYYYMNYSPIMLSKIEEGTNIANRVEDFPETWEGIYCRFHYLEQARRGGLFNNFKGGQHCIELARRGAHPYNQKVFTPEGWKNWGDIKIGDKLYSTYNTECTVIDIPFDGNAKYYRVTLKDGREIYASDNHIWKVIKSGKEKLKTTEWLFNHYISHRTPNERVPSGIEYQYAIPKNEGIEYITQNTKVDPYTFGVLLGDGCFRHKYNCYLTQSEDDFNIIKNYIPYEYKKLESKYEYKLFIPNWKNILIEYGMYFSKSIDKFIPDEFKYNNREVRLNILKGLFDTDGHIHGGVPTITTVSNKLKDDILFVARSLGYNCFYTKQKAGYKNKGVYVECSDVYIIQVYGGSELFNLPRKQHKVKYTSPNAKSRRDRVKIVNIEYIGKTPCKCVTVDSEDECYLIGDFVTTHNCSKSFSLASIMAHNFVLGENSQANKRTMTVLTAYQKEYLAGKDGTLNKFTPMIDFVSQHTQFPRKRLKNSNQEMTWQMGYKDVETGVDKGTLNTVIGVSSKDDESKLRGKRGYILVEEMGSFPKLLEIYNITRYGVEEGDYTFGLIYLVGTSGDSESDFGSAKEMMYSPSGYNIYALPNVFDKVNQGRPNFGFFFPAYVNRKGCYDKDGNSDVIKALIQILQNRYHTKYNSEDPNTITKVIAEMPITPAEAIIKVTRTLFPVTDLSERLLQIENNPTEYDDVYVGELIINNGKVDFKPTTASPIRSFPHKDNKIAGAIEIFKMPEKDPQGKVFPERYILGCDPYDDDSSETMSLGSIFVLDLWTDRIVAEYTGRPMFAEDFFETCRRLCLFYNGKLNYENNKKGLYAHFKKMNSLFLLTDVLEFLKDKDMIKADSLVGNKLKGTGATAPINGYAISLQRDWLLKTTTDVQNIDGESVEVEVPNLYKLRNKALIQEYIAYNQEGNFDRISAMGMLMLLREDMMVLYGGEVKKTKDVSQDKDYLGNDDFFSKNFSHNN